MPGTRKLGRPTAHRNAMLRGMVTYLLENGKIETTLTRAKEVGALTEKMITIGKKNTLAAPRRGDGVERALIKLTLEEKAEEKTEEKSAKKKSSKRTAKKAEKKTEEKVEEKTEETAEEKAE